MGLSVSVPRLSGLRAHRLRRAVQPAHRRRFGHQCIPRGAQWRARPTLYARPVCHGHRRQRFVRQPVLVLRTARAASGKRPRADSTQACFGTIRKRDTLYEPAAAADLGRRARTHDGSFCQMESQSRSDAAIRFCIRFIQHARSRSYLCGYRCRPRIFPACARSHAEFFHRKPKDDRHPVQRQSQRWHRNHRHSLKRGTLGR